MPDYFPEGCGLSLSVSRSFFAARVERADPGGWVQVDAQACADRLCAMVDALPVPVTRSGERSVDPETLAVVGEPGGEQAAADAARQQLAVFGDWFQRSMDIECSGQVPIARLVNEVIGARHDRPLRHDSALRFAANIEGSEGHQGLHGAANALGHSGL